MMDKATAGQIAEEKLKDFLQQEPEVIKTLLTESEHEFFVKNGTAYQLRIDAFYDDKKLGRIRVTVAVDDQKFWSTLAPLWTL
jgi:hypothetical protein